MTRTHDFLFDGRHCIFGKTCLKERQERAEQQYIYTGDIDCHPHLPSVDTVFWILARRNIGQRGHLSHVYHGWDGHDACFEGKTFPRIEASMNGMGGNQDQDISGHHVIVHIIMAWHSIAFLSLHSTYTQVHYLRLPSLKGKYRHLTSASAAHHLQKPCSAPHFPASTCDHFRP